MILEKDGEDQLDRLFCFKKEAYVLGSLSSMEGLHIV